MAAMNFDVICRFTRLWPLLLIVGAVGFVSIVLINSNAYPMIGGKYLSFYLIWASVLLITVGAALGFLAFVCGPKRAVFAMGLGSYVWYRALSVPDGAVTFFVRDSIMLSAVGAYLLTIGTLAAIAHALSGGTGTQAKSFGLHRGTNSANGVRAGQSRASTVRGAAVGAGAASVVGLAAASANLADEEGGNHGVKWDDSSPSVNVDGTPMVGSIDIHGNPYGVTNDKFTSGSFGDNSFGNDSFSNGGFGNQSF